MFLRHVRPSFRHFATQASNKPKGSPKLYIAAGVLAVGGAASLYAFRADGPEPKKSTTSMNLICLNNLSKRLLIIRIIEKLFTKEDSTIIFVLGGPGAGKGTQCANLVRDFGFKHLSAGDLLRAERERPGSKYGDLINNYIKEGQIVPMEITIALLEKAMVESGTRKFLIDGFPRKMDQALEFERTICESTAVLYFECPDEEMLKRLLKRGETSGRVDDNEESIKKRFKTFHETSFPVIEFYEKLGKVKKISCLNSPDGVYSEVKNILGNHVLTDN
jgi:UMP-CMP kinase